MQWPYVALQHIGGRYIKMNPIFMEYLVKPCSPFVDNSSILQGNMSSTDTFSGILKCCPPETGLTVLPRVSHCQL